MTKVSKVSKVSVGRRSVVDCCHRCGGLMVPEQVHELASFEWRCVSCGERVDPVILTHRRGDFVRPEGEKVSTGHAKLQLS